MFSISIDWHCECGDSAASHYSYPEGERCVGHCQHTKVDCNGQGYRPIDHTGRTPAQSAIIAEAARSYWPKHYTSDLSLDYQSLCDYDGSFIWVLREMGTHFYPLEVEGEDTPGWQSSYIRQALRYHRDNGNGDRVFHWLAAKAELREVDWDTALAIASTAHAAPVAA